MKMVRLFPLLLFILLLSGCRGGETDKMVITFWAIGAEGEKVGALIPAFERENPGVKVKVQQIPWTAAHEKLITAYVSETLPDVFQLGNTWVPEFRALGAVEPLTAYLEKDSVGNEKFFDGIWDSNVIDSVLYALPWYVDTRLLFYRKDILAAAGFVNPPVTWKELYDASVKIKQMNPRYYSLFLPTNEWSQYIIFGLQSGSGILKDNNSYGDFSGREFREALEYVSGYFKNKLSPIDMTAVTNIYQAFEEGYFAMLITGPWNIKEMQNRLSPAMQDKWMTAPLPAKGDDYPGVSLAGGSSLAINKLSPRKELAWKFVSYLTRAEVQAEFYKLVSSLPSVMEAWESPELKNDKYLAAFYSQLQNVKPTPKIPEWEQIVVSKIQQYIERLAAQKLTVDETAKKLDEEANRILEKRRWMISREGR